MQNIKKLLFLLTKREKKLAALLLLMTLIMAFIDMVGIASILPFMAVLTNPTLVESNNTLNFMFQVSKSLGVENSKEFLFALGILLFTLLVLSLFFKALTTYAQLRFIHMREYTLSRRLMDKYLNQKYSWFLNHHSADLGKNILAEVGLIISGYLKPLINLIAQGLVCISIILLLVLTDPKLAFITGFTLLLGIWNNFFFYKKIFIQNWKKKTLK